MFDVVCSDVWGALLAWSDNRRKKTMKRVICWDLWGTLIRSAYTGETYEKYIARWKNLICVQAAIRCVLMTEEAYRDPAGVNAATEDRPLTYEEAYSILYRRLFIPSGPYNWPMEIAGIPDRDEVIRRWKEENEAAEWIPGVWEMITRMRAERLDDRHILVTNTTSPGWETVENKLKISNVFGGYSRIERSTHHLAAKPDPSIWQWVMGANPFADEYWMIGDDPVIDIAVPAAMGWKTILVGEKGVPVSDVPKIINGGE